MIFKSSAESCLLRCEGAGDGEGDKDGRLKDILLNRSLAEGTGDKVGGLWVSLMEGVKDMLLQITGKPKI